MIDTLGVASPNGLVQCLLWARFLPLPLDNSGVNRRVRTLLYYLLFILPSILEFGILSEVISLLRFRKFNRKLLKCLERII